MTISPGNSRTIAQESGEEWVATVGLQPTIPKSDRLLGEFGALVIGGAISGQTQTTTTFIYNALEERQEAAAYGMALILAVASALFLLLLEWIKRRRDKEK